MITQTRRRTSLVVVALLMSIFVTVIVAGRTVTSAAAIGACPAGATLNVVAHEDDDILFQSPDLLHTVQSGRCVRTVYFTAGDNGESRTYWSGREIGVQAAYASMAGVANSWTISDAGVAGHPIALMTLNGSPGISLMFLRLPDGNIDGSGFSGTGFESLQKLYTGAITTIHAVDGTSSYTKAGLLSTLLGFMTSFQPDSINTLDYVGSYGDGDHSDHHTVAYLTQQAQLQYATPHGFAGYQGYGIASKASNVSGSDLTTKTNTFFGYAQFDANTCSTAAACASRPEGSWFSRQYTVGTPTPPPTTQPPTGTNVAGLATVTASSENAADGQTAVKAVDGVVDGYPGNYSREWATKAGKAGSWLQLSWPGSVTVGSVVLFDRPNMSDQVTAGTLTFSDGSTVAVPALENAGAGVTVTFPVRSTTSLRLTVSGVSASTGNVGLAELQAWAPGSTTTSPPATTPPATTPPSTTPPATTTPAPSATNVAGLATVTASSENAADGQTAVKAVDGVVDGYPGDYSREWATKAGKAGSWLQLSWPGSVTVGSVVLFDRPNMSDQVTAGTLTFSDGSTVAVPALENAGAGVTVTFPVRSTTSLRLTVSGVSASTGNVGLAELQAWAPGSTTTSPPATTTPPATTPVTTPPATPVTTPPVTTPPVTTPVTTTPPATTTPAPTATNVAGLATVTASSENAADGQTAVKAVDGVVDGYPGDYSREWATKAGKAGSWLQLSWPGSVTVGSVVLFDRPNMSDQVTAGTLTFSDGSTVAVPALENAGAGVTVTFPVRSTTSLRLTVSGVSASTGNVGLAELQAWQSA